MDDEIEYDDEAYANAVMNLFDAIEEMIEAGASHEDVRNEVAAKLRDA